MRVKLKGIHSAKAKLADGTTRTYWYAWRGGPRLPGKPGEPEFVAAYNEAVKQKVAPPPGSLLAVLNAYQASADFESLAPRTRADYVRQIRKIETQFRDFPLAALSDRRARAVFLNWRDEMARASRRQADYAWTVLARVLAWALNRGLVTANPCTKAGRLYRGSRADKVWTLDDEQRFLDAAPDHLRLPFLLALYTGQRQGDLLRLTWTAYDGERIRLRQSKTGARVMVPVHSKLREALDLAQKEKSSPLVLVNSRGRAWTADGFRASWRKACDAAGIEGVTFNDLRGTAVTRLAMAGCTEAEIATLSGHSLKDVRSILDAHYLHRDERLAVSAISKLEAGTNLQNGRQNVRACSAGE